METIKLDLGPLGTLDIHLRVKEKKVLNNELISIVESSIDSEFTKIEILNVVFEYSGDDSDVLILTNAKEQFKVPIL